MWCRIRSGLSKILHTSTYMLGVICKLVALNGWPAFGPAGIRQSGKVPRALGKVFRGLGDSRRGFSRTRGLFRALRDSWPGGHSWICFQNRRKSSGRLQIYWICMKIYYISWFLLIFKPAARPASPRPAEGRPAIHCHELAAHPQHVGTRIRGICSLSANVMPCSL